MEVKGIPVLGHRQSAMRRAQERVEVGARTSWKLCTDLMQNEGRAVADMLTVHDRNVPCQIARLKLRPGYAHVLADMSHQNVLVR